MYIDYTVTPEDLTQFNLHVNRSTTIFRRKRQRSLLICTLIAVALFATSYLVRGNIPLAAAIFLAAFIILVVGVTAYVAVAPILRRTTYKLIRGGVYKGILGQHSILLTPEALEDASDVGNGQLLWKAIERIDITNLAIYVFIADTRGVIIPRHSFQDEAQYRSFGQLMKQYHTTAREQLTTGREA
jgi:hypothetical protein